MSVIYFIAVCVQVSCEVSTKSNYTTINRFIVLIHIKQHD